MRGKLFKIKIRDKKEFCVIGAYPLTKERPRNEGDSNVIIKDYVKQITKTELELLLQMLKDLEHDAYNPSAKAYGYNEKSKYWDDSVFERYKNKTLSQRFEKKGYTFFLLKQKSSTVALASGNVYFQNTQYKLRLLNFVVSSDHKQKGLSTELFEYIVTYCIKHSISELSFDMSPFSQSKNLEIFGYFKSKYSLRAKLPKEPTNESWRVTISDSELESIVSPPPHANLSA